MRELPRKKGGERLKEAGRIHSVGQLEATFLGVIDVSMFPLASDTFILPGSNFDGFTYAYSTPESEEPVC